MENTIENIQIINKEWNDDSIDKRNEALSGKIIEYWHI